jgi:hypothetical protein
VIRGLVAGVALALVGAAPAGAHGVIHIAGGDLVYLSDDSSSASLLEIDADLVQIKVYDPGSVGGIQAPSSCRAGKVDDRGTIIEWTCPAAGVVRIGAEVGPSEDSAVVRGSLPVRLHGDAGADSLRTGDASDVLRGRDGNDQLWAEGGDDVVEPGEGADAISAGPGADTVSAADGERDSVACGDGADRVTADQLDVVDADCETVVRSTVAPPAGAAEGDTTAPRLSVRVDRTQRAGRIRLTARSSEAGSVDASAFLAVDGVNLRVPPVERAVRAGRRASLSLRLSRSQLRRVRRRGRARLTVTLVAADRAGNTTRPRTVHITLRP